MSQIRIAIPLAVTIAIVPFAVDTYLSAFPAMAEFYSTNVHGISRSISVYIFALALGQLVGGPLADRFGRQVVMRLGLGLFVLTSLVTTQTDTLTSLLWVRAAQAFGGGWVMVCVPALVRDRMHGAEAARMFSLIGLIMVAAPAIAPALGAFLMYWQWQAIFYFLAAYGLVAFITLELLLFRSQQSKVEAHQPQKLNAPSPLQRYATVLKTKGALRYVFLQAMLFSVMMLFVTHASFIYQSHYQVSSKVFSILFAANILTMWLTMMATRALLNRYSPSILLKFAVSFQALSVTGLILIVGLNLPVYFYAPALMMSIGALGATSPNCQACYMEFFEQNGATASAIMGATQFGVAGTVSAISTFLPEQVLIITLMQAVCCMAALVLVLWPRVKAVTALSPESAEQDEISTSCST